MARASYDIHKSKNSAKDEWYYVQVGSNGKTMNTSEMYPSKENAKRGAKDARRAARFAKIVDKTE